MSERYKAEQALPVADRPKFWAEVPCPKTHPAPVVLRARRGDQTAATEVLFRLRESGQSSWYGVTVEEMAELAAGDTKAVQARRRQKAAIRQRYYRNPLRFTRWSVSVDIELRQGSYLSTHKEFSSLKGAVDWAKTFVDNPETLTAYLEEMNAASDLSNYEITSATQVRILDVRRERLSYPWHWINGYEVWWPVASEWRWESDSYKALVAEGDARWEARKKAS